MAKFSKICKVNLLEAYYTAVKHWSQSIFTDCSHHVAENALLMFIYWTHILQRNFWFAISPVMTIWGPFINVPTYSKTLKQMANVKEYFFLQQASYPEVQDWVRVTLKTESSQLWFHVGIKSRMDPVTLVWGVKRSNVNYANLRVYYWHIP